MFALRFIRLFLKQEANYVDPDHITQMWQLIWIYTDCPCDKRRIHGVKVIIQELFYVYCVITIEAKSP
jgi:hypothetical protein